jgi:hypothetical protein
VVFWCEEAEESVVVFLGTYCFLVDEAAGGEVLLRWDLGFPFWYILGAGCWAAAALLVLPLLRGEEVGLVLETATFC